MIQAPNTASVYRDNKEYSRYCLPFAPELTPFILNKTKTVTFRFGTKYSYLKVGDHVEIIDRATDQKVAVGLIEDIVTLSFSELPINIDGHESYRDKEHQREVLSRYYAHIGRSIEDSDLFIVIRFRLIEKSLK